MAARTTAVGTASWIAAEKENAVQLLQNEKEEVIYPAQHQLEWLNEHMAEIFSQSHLYVASCGLGTDRPTDLSRDVANVFKTPGKMRGKTPRTGRKRAAQDARIVSILVPCGLVLIWFTAAPQRRILIQITTTTEPPETTQSLKTPLPNRSRSAASDCQIGYRFWLPHRKPGRC